MNKIAMILQLLSAAVLAAGAGAVSAATLALPQDSGTAGAVTATPGRGQTMEAVERRFGAPEEKHAAVGGDSPKHPPITRWDYAGFSVFFEHSHVVTTVVPGNPPEIYAADELQH